MTEVDTLVVSVPEDMRKPPDTWDPRLAYQLAHESRNASVAFIDWAYWRFPLEVLLRDMAEYKAERTVVWAGSLRTYANLHALMGRLEGEQPEIMGFPELLPWPRKQWIGERDLRSLTLPRWSLFETEGYWQLSAQPDNIDTAQWRARVPLQFCLPRGKLPPRRVASILLSLKLLNWFDSATWLDDLAADPLWTRSILRYMEIREVRFQFKCRAGYAALDQGLIFKLRESGCKVIDLGRLPTALFKESQTTERLLAAVNACNKYGVTPTFTPVINNRTLWSDAQKTTEFMNVTNIHTEPEIEPDWADLTHEEKITYSMFGYANPDPSLYSDAEILGLQRLMAAGLATRIKP